MIVIEESKDVNIITFDKLMVSIQAHEQCIDERS